MGIYWVTTIGSNTSIVCCLSARSISSLSSRTRWRSLNLIYFTIILSSTRTGDIHTLRFMIFRHHTHTSIHQNILHDTPSSTPTTSALFFLPVTVWWHFACRGKVSPSNLLQITLHVATHTDTSLVSIHISIYLNDFPFIWIMFTLTYN